MYGAYSAIREAFQALDVDDDGLISTDDVRTLLRLFNPDMDNSDTQKIINEASSCGKFHGNYSLISSDILYLSLSKFNFTDL